MAGNYQVAKGFNPNDPLQPISAITHTLPGPRYNLVSKGATQVRNTLEDPCIQTAMNVCVPSYDPVIIVEAALKVFHGELHVGSPTGISERAQERIEDHIILTLHQECINKGLDPNQHVDRRAMMHRPHLQQRTSSSGFGCNQNRSSRREPLNDDWDDEPEDAYQQECYSRCESDSQYRYQDRQDESRDRSCQD